MLLCAHVQDTVWICYSPDCASGGSFSFEDLLVKDVVAEAAAQAPPRKRAKGRASGSPLSAWASRHTSAWNLVVAAAGFKAEECRAAAGHRTFDEAAASAGFEANPWQWPPNSAHAEVAALWVWQRSGERRHELVKARLHHALERQAIPSPADTDADGALWDRLLRAAELEGELRKAPCKYLGLEWQGVFEADPAKWPAQGYQAGLGKTKAEVCFCWEHVTLGGKPLHGSISVTHLLHGKNAVPHNPLPRSAPYGLTFTPAFLAAVAENVLPGLCYKGVVYDAEKPELTPALPHGGRDLQDEQLYWALPCGSVRCWSLRELVEARPHEKAPADSAEAYRSVAAELGYDVLGQASDADLLWLREEPGTLAERRWDSVSWTTPQDEASSCWWLANAGEEDGGEEPKFLCRSLTVLRLELSHARIASSAKLRRAWEGRQEDNARAVEALLNNAGLWRHVRGPDPELLMNPTEELLVAAHAAASSAEALAEVRRGADGLDSYAAELTAAVGKLRVCSWDAIRRERFNLTPPALFDELARTAEVLLGRRAGEAERRRLRLAAAAPVEAEGGEEEEQPPLPVAGRERDRYGLDLDEFKCRSGRKPRGWLYAVQAAAEVAIDQMRCLLELHYDDVHLEAWRRADAAKTERRAPARKSEHVVFRGCQNVQRRQLNQRLLLPASVKEILRRPADELCWDALERLRAAVVSELLREGELALTPKEAECLAQGLEACSVDTFPDEVGPGCPLLPEGARLALPLPSGAVAELRAVAAEVVRGSAAVRYWLRPLGTLREPPLSKTARTLLESGASLRELADRSTEAWLDELLLTLWDALFLAQATDWSGRGVANLPAWETLELARWWLRGQRVGQQPLFDGICAMCACLLFGEAGGALSNKAAGPPCNRDGERVDDVGAPPPCLLRYSPAAFAKAVPAVFVHDPATNRLSLRPGQREPWLRPRRGGGPPTEWLYCIECKGRWFPSAGQRSHSHVPFRDRASQPLMKKVERAYQSTGRSEAMPQAAEDERSSECGASEELPPPVLEDDDEDDVMEAAAEPAAPYLPAPRPSLADYEAKWAHEEARHARAVPGPFSRDNLVPTPVPVLWQDCPFVPFGDLKSDEAQARLAVVRPISGLEPASVADGVPRYAHNTGDVNFRRRALLQLASTFGFVVGRNGGGHLHLTPVEEAAVHECLTWARQGHNKVLTFFGTVYEQFAAACGQLVEKFRSVLPAGSTRARIRATKRETREQYEAELGTTLGQESVGMVVVDLSGCPLKYDKLTVFSDVVATQATRVEIDVPAADGRGWRRSGSSVDVGRDFDEAWRTKVREGCRHLLTETWVPANDPHYDAKCFPCAHPYGTGSLLSEPGSGGTQRHARSRLTALEGFFRRSALWGFWMLDRLIKTELFFKERRRRQAGRPSVRPDDPDKMKVLFGTAQPADIPESSAWWQRQQRDLLAMSADEELGLMSAMVTITANDSCSEMLAAVRRGPFAVPTADEALEYLLTTKSVHKDRPHFEEHSLEHVLSFQRRVHAAKKHFFKRGAKTPLGRLREWWDRTEAQMRAALHSHILCWFRLRDQRARDEKLESEGRVPYEPLAAVPRTAPGVGPRQRPAAQLVEPPSEHQEFDGYHQAEMGRVIAEMVRPDVSGDRCGGYGVEQLRVAGLARAVQSRLYLHSCTARYCLQNRASCRFLYPWPLQPVQQYDENCERVALRRRCQEDDQWLVPHELYLAMFSPATVNVLPFDPRHGADQARQYAAKYASKPEKWYYMEVERNGVKDFLQCRTVGLCMTHNRLLNFHVVRSTRPVQFVPANFLPGAEYRHRREEGHLAKYPGYPDKEFYLSFYQKYLFRPAELLHLRVEQLNRYFAATEGGAAATLEDTLSDDEDPPPPEEGHRHYDEEAESLAAGSVCQSRFQGVGGWRRRQSERLGVARTPFFEMLGEKREPFYEQRLALALPWHCPEGPEPVEGGGCRWRLVWTPPRPASLGGAVIPPQEIVLEPGGGVSFEELAADLEVQLCLPEHGLVCRCCLGELPGSACQRCRFAVGLHRCQDQRSPRGFRWRKGCLYAGSLDAQRILWNLHRKGLPFQALRDKAAVYEQAGLLSPEHSKAVVAAIEQERDIRRVFNEPVAEGGSAPEAGRAEQDGRLTREQLQEELRQREANMQSGGTPGAPTDQWRVYQHVVRCLRDGPFLRLLVQASAGTGKSYLLTTIFLWCLLNGKRCKAAAPTGIASANVALEGTDVRACTLHNMFDFDGEMKTSLDFAKLSHPKVAELMAMEVFLGDEISMLDAACWSSVEEVLSIIDHSKRPTASKEESRFGQLHVLLFGDFKQLPPATSRPPFVVLPSVHEGFDFLVLRQNRRVTADPARAQELEAFHGVLADVSEGRPSEAVRGFLVEAYVRGAVDGCAEKAAVENTTAIFTKRRFRDRWNRTMVRRIGKVHNHFLKVRGRVRARGARGQQWFTEARTALLRRRARAQAAWNLHLAGDFHADLETKPLPPRQHLMRVMLISNVAVDQRFANGTQGRLLSWTPAAVENGKALSAGHPELTARFAKESAMRLTSMVPEARFFFGVGKGRDASSSCRIWCFNENCCLRCFLRRSISWICPAGKRPSTSVASPCCSNCPSSRRTR